MQQVDNAPAFDFRVPSGARTAKAAMTGVRAVSFSTLW
jgi:hypothetical protein